MKRIALILFLLLMVSSAYASQPPVTDPLRFTGEPSMTSIPPPPASDSGSYSCEAWTVRNEKCEGNLRLYEQCTQMVTNNIWNWRSENCAELGATCQNGVCVGYGTNPPNPVIPVCGNAKCDGSETSATCPGDCGGNATNNNVMWLVLIGVGVFLFIKFFGGKKK